MADCGRGCAKCMLILFNIIFMLTGAALFAVGLWVRFDKNVWDYIGFVSVSQTDPYIEYGAYLLIAVGAFILVTSVLGCCGAIRESKCCLGLYIFILLFVLCAEIAGGVLVIVYQNKIKNEFEALALAELQNPNVTYNQNGQWSAFATSVNLVQKEFKCCGIKGVSDYANLDSALKNCGMAPCSCYMILANSTSVTDPNALTASNVDLNAIHSKSCVTEVTDFFEKYSVVFIGLAIGFACLEMFGLIFALCLCVTAGSKDV